MCMCIVFTCNGNFLFLQGFNGSDGSLGPPGPSGPPVSGPPSLYVGRCCWQQTLRILPTQ